MFDIIVGGVSRRRWNCAAIIILLVGCNSAPNRPASDGRLQVFAGIPPLAGIVERIGSQRVIVESLVAPGQDPHTFEPSPRQAAALARAAVVFKVGMPFETAVIEKLRSGNPRLRVVDVAEGIKKRPLENPCSEHEHEHEAAGAAFDPHVWLSPPLLKTVAARAAEELSTLDPAGAEEYRKNLARFQNELDALHKRITEQLSPYRGRTFIVYHPGFGYFADAYGLKELAVQAGGHAPTSKQLRELVELARRQNIKTVFVQPEFDQRGARIVAETLGGEAVRLDGLPRDVLGGLEEIAEKIERAFGG
jgi:zinc transport system substrate-binding protein